MFVDLDGLRFFTLSMGAGPRTLLAHSGWVGNYEDWLPTLAVLSRNWRAVTYDHRGTGETVAPSERITAEALVDDVFRVMDRLSIDRCVLAGFSSGTLPVVRAALRDPSRFDGLVLANGTAGVTDPAAPPRAIPTPDQWPGASHAERMRWFIEKCTPEPDVEHVRRMGHHMLMRATPEAAARLWRIGQPVDDRFLEALGGLTLPTLIIHGELDPFASAGAMRYLSGQIAGSRLEVLPGSGHVPAMVIPDTMASLINDFFGVQQGR
jgi:pimeloyl-ACP methyl ester carboxylesterase